MTTRTVFGAGPGLSFGAFTPTHRADQVEAALRGYLPPDDLERLSRLVGKAADRRRRSRKAPGPLEPLADLLARAAQPPTAPVAMRWYPTMTGGEPLPCELLDGDQAGHTVTIVPPGVQFRFVDPKKIIDSVYCQPVDDQGADLGGRAWHIDSAGAGRTVRVGAGTYLVPFDAIRTGDGRDAR